MLTPQDIESKMFKVSFKGYNTEEVDDFLQEICDSYEEIYTEITKYKEQNARLAEAVGKYKSMEGTLKDALSVADLSSEEAARDAEGKANIVISNAEKIAADIIAGARQKTEQEAQRFNEIQQKVEIYKSKITDLINAQLSVLGQYPTAVAEVPEQQSDDSIDNTQEIETKTKTENLPTIKMNENGEYVQAE